MELLELTRTLPRGWDRRSLEKNAVAVLSHTDAPRAMRMLASLDYPIPRFQTVIPADLRGYAARTVFLEYWKARAVAGVPEIRRRARQIGDTGLYPFGATGPILRELAGREPHLAESWCREANRYHRRGSSIANADVEFGEFLDSVWGVFPADIRRELLDAAVSSLLRSPPLEIESYRAVVYKGKEPVEFTRSSDRLLYHLLPKLWELDPARAERIVQERPQLNRAALTEPIDSEAEVGIRGEARTAEPGYRDSVESQALDRQRLTYLGTQVQSDPSGALAAVESLADPGARAEGFLAIARAVSATKPEYRLELVRRANTELQRTTDSSAQIRILAAIGEWDNLEGDPATTARAVERALDLGEELFEQFSQTHPATSAHEAPFLGIFEP